MLFLDGVGLGSDDPRVNPFAAVPTPTLDALAGGPWTAARPAVAAAGRRFAPLDATFGHPDLPQSATGQTALLTGRDALAAMGRPYGPWPGPTLVRLLEADGVFHDARAVGGAALANAYPRRYLDALPPGAVAVPGAPPAAAGRRARLRPAAALVAARAAGVSVRSEADARRGAAVTADLGFDGGAPAAGAVVAWARSLAALAREQALTWLDAWVTDRVGHRADRAEARALVAHLDAVLEALVSALDRVTLVVVSDHGNLEDPRDARHTRAPVPLAVHGAAADAFAGAGDLRALRPALRRAWGLPPGPA